MYGQGTYNGPGGPEGHNPYGHPSAASTGALYPPAAGAPPGVETSLTGYGAGSGTQLGALPTGHERPGIGSQSVYFGSQGGIGRSGEWRGRQPGPGYARGVGGGFRSPSGYRHHGPPAGMRFAAVRLRGLPFGVREYEVAMFLELDPVDIVLCLRHGKPSGEAIVVLGTLEELDFALRKNRQYMGPRYIEIFEARKSDYYRAVCDVVLSGENDGIGRFRERKHSHDHSHSSRERSRSPAGSHKPGGAAPGTTKIVRLRGLPFTAREEDIMNFFTDESLELSVTPTAERVTLALGAESRPTGMAFVEFDSTEDAEKALKKDKASMGSRYIELFLATEDERARWLPVR